jgi:hypothetical protein
MRGGEEGGEEEEPTRGPGAPAKFGAAFAKILGKRDAAAQSGHLGGLERLAVRTQKAVLIDKKDDGAPSPHALGQGRSALEEARGGTSQYGRYRATSARGRRRSNRSGGGGGAAALRGGGCVWCAWQLRCRHRRATPSKGGCCCGGAATASPAGAGTTRRRMRTSGACW